MILRGDLHGGRSRSAQLAAVVLAASLSVPGAAAGQRASEEEDAGAAAGQQASEEQDAGAAAGKQAPDEEDAGAAAGKQAPDEEDASTTDEPARAKAREAYAKGERLFEQGRFDEAEEAFGRAYGHVPNPVVLLGIAKTRQRQGEVAGAVRAYAKYLAERPEAPDRKRIEAKIAQLEATPGVLRVRSEPPGAVVSIDGEEGGRTTPAELQLAPGEHTVAVHLEGRPPREQTVQIEPGGTHTLELGLGETAEDEMFGAGDGVEEPKPEASAAADDEDRPISTGVWVATGVSASALVAGTVLGFIALNEQSEFDEMPTAGRADKGERLALFADVAFGVALGAAITGLVLYLTEGDAKKADSESAGLRLRPSVSREGGGVDARVRF